MSLLTPFRFGRTTFMSLGDSLMSVYPNYDASVDGPQQSFFGSNSWQAIGNALADSPLIQRGSAATGGYMVQEIIDEHLPTVLSVRPAICAVDGGGNNIGSDENADAAIDKLPYIFETLADAGIQAIVVTMPQLGQTDPAVTSRIQRINTFLLAYAHEQGLPILDLTTILTDPETGTYPVEKPIPGAPDQAWTTDGTHPNGIGTRAIARAFAKLISQLLPNQTGEPLLAVTNDLEYAAPNPLLRSTSGTNTPDGYTVYTGSGTTRALTPGPVGNKFSIEYAEGEDQVIFGPSLAVSPGDEVLFAAKVTASVEGSFKVGVFDAAAYDIALIGEDMGSGIAAGYGWQTDLDDNVVVYRAFIAADSPDKTVRPQFKIRGSGDSSRPAKLTISQVTVRNLTASRTARTVAS